MRPPSWPPLLTAGILTSMGIPAWKELIVRGIEIAGVVNILTGIVVIRTFLSFSLEVEIDGRWPWTRADATRLDASLATRR